MWLTADMSMRMVMRALMISKEPIHRRGMYLRRCKGFRDRRTVLLRVSQSTATPATGADGLRQNTHRRAGRYVPGHAPGIFLGQTASNDYEGVCGDTENGRNAILGQGSIARQGRPSKTKGRAAALRDRLACAGVIINRDLVSRRKDAGRYGDAACRDGYALSLSVATST